MRSLADGLPPEIAARVHPDWYANERAYWAVRDTLLAEYAGQWVLFDAGRVVASGRPPVKVFHAAPPGSHPYFACVGAEFEPFRIRRAAFPYDTTYSREPLPQVSAEFRPVATPAPGIRFDGVIPDTGADTTVLPWADCTAIGLDPIDGIPAALGGVGGRVPSMAFWVVITLAGTEHTCLMNADLLGGERILGRDVLNRLDVLFRGPAGEVVVDP